MALNESMVILINQGLEELNKAQISFGLKILVIFGVIYLFNIVTKTGISIIHLGAYIFGLVKWVTYKIKRKEV